MHIHVYIYMFVYTYIYVWHFVCACVKTECAYIDKFIQIVANLPIYLHIYLHICMEFALITWYQGQIHVVIWLSLRSLITGRFCNKSKVGLGFATLYICKPHPHTQTYQKKFKQAGRQIPRRVEFNEPVWIIRLHHFTIKALRSWDGGA